MTVDRWGVCSRDQHGVIDNKRRRNELATPARRGAELTVLFNNSARSIQMYSMYEAFARERMREHLEQAAQRRLSAHVASARMWRRLAVYSAGRAARSSRRLAEHSAAEYQLVA
ncbi:MAG TPA: hypothetical protein VFU36_15905 [Jatrophihabitans sp.]|nr:hypothetical protein [Jatrophihabitans sp.]